MNAPTYRAVFFDFGGVLTTSVFEALADFGASISSDAQLPLRLLAKDPIASQLLADHEEGRLDHQGFESGFAQRLNESGASVEANGLLSRMQSGLLPDQEMLALLNGVRNAGVKVALVSNSLGDNCYDGFDLDSLFDEVVISGLVGVRKPGRRIYEIACEQLDIEPAEAIMIDDLQHNLDGAARLGITGVLHQDARATTQELGRLLAAPSLV